MFNCTNSNEYIKLTKISRSFNTLYDSIYEINFLNNTTICNIAEGKKNFQAGIVMPLFCMLFELPRNIFDLIHY